MEFGVVKYLQQSNPTKDLWYSEPLYVNSAVSGANTVAKVNYGEFGAIYILITGIIISSGIVAGAAAPVTFRDQYNRVMFVMDASREGNGFYPISQVISGEECLITANFNTTYNFSVQHQYLREVDKATFQHG